MRELTVQHSAYHLWVHTFGHRPAGERQRRVAFADRFAIGLPSSVPQRAAPSDRDIAV